MTEKHKERELFRQNAIVTRVIRFLHKSGIATAPLSLISLEVFKVHNHFFSIEKLIIVERSGERKSIVSEDLRPLLHLKIRRLFENENGNKNRLIIEIESRRDFSFTFLSDNLKLI